MVEVKSCGEQEEASADGGELAEADGGAIDVSVSAELPPKKVGSPSRSRRGKGSSW